MRLFVALEISPEVRETLSALIGELRALGPGARWVRPENLHVTLKFIGEAPSEKLPAIRVGLAQARPTGSISMEFTGLGFFPHERSPRVFWVGIRPGEALARLAGEIDGCLASLGIPRERRAFSPHLTLARFPEPRRQEKLQAATRDRASQSFGTVLAREFFLFQSELRPEGARHTKVGSFPLQIAES